MDLSENMLGKVQLPLLPWLLIRQQDGMQRVVWWMGEQVVRPKVDCRSSASLWRRQHMIKGLTG
jgi:hypothetical protein